MSTAETLNRKSPTPTVRAAAYEDGYQARYDGEDRESWPVKLSDDELEAWREGWDDCANGHQCYLPEEEE